MTIFRENHALLTAFREGKEAALRTVYSFYVNDILILLRLGFTEKRSGKRIKGIPDLEHQRELLQETFLRAFSSRARMGYDGLRPYKSYISTIAGNVMIDAWRSGNRDPISFDRWDCEEIELEQELENPHHNMTESGGAEEKLHWQRCLEASDKYVAKLDSTSQEYVRLRFQKDLPQREVGRLMNISHSKVRTLEKRIRTNLRIHLKKLKLIEI